MSSYWLVKTEPEAFSWQQLEKDGITSWDGVRNYQARNNLMKMKIGDFVLIYHSVSDKEIVGIGKVVREFYPDPSVEDKNWVAVDIVPEKKLKKRVPLQKIKENPALANISLIKQSRLSVMPIEDFEFSAIIQMSE